MITPQLVALLLFQQFQVIPPPPPPPEFGNAAQILQNGEGLVQGVVTRADTSVGVRDVAVRLNTQGTRTKPPAVLNTLTDADGKFGFGNLPFDTYIVTATRDGYFTPLSDGTQATTAQSRVILDSLRKTANVPVELNPAGVIAGIVRDTAGQPVANIPVRAMRLVYRKGQRALSVARVVDTDDRGAFRLVDLPPGEYYVRADVRPTAVPLEVEGPSALRTFSLRSGDRGAGGSTAAFPTSFSPTYAPGVAAPGTAVSFRVRGADELKADIQLEKTSPVRISGTVVSAVDGSPQNPIGFLLLPKDVAFDEGTASALISNSAQDRSGGRFELSVARPGRYDLVAVVPRTLRTTTSVGLRLGRIVYDTAKYPIQVGDKDIADIPFAVLPGNDLDVRYVSASGSVDLSRGTGYVLRSRDATDTTPLIDDTGLIINPDGRVFYSIAMSPSVKFPALPEGEYQFEFPYAPPGAYVADIKQGGRSVQSDGIVTVGRTSAEPVEVVLSAGAGKVSGKVQVPAGMAFRTAQVTIVPQGARHGNPMFYVRDGSANDGTFDLEHIAPGEYKLYAFEVLPLTADENDAFMAQYESSGRAIVIRENSSIADITLPLIRAPK